MPELLRRLGDQGIKVSSQNVSMIQRHGADGVKELVYALDPLSNGKPLFARMFVGLSKN